MINFLPAHLYNPAYLSVMTLVTLYLFYKYAGMGTEQLINTRRSYAFSVILALVLTIVIGLRPRSIFFGDMGAYIGEYNRYADGTKVISTTQDPVWTSIMYAFATSGLRVEWFFLLVEFIYIFCIFWACRRFSPDNTDILFVAALSAMSFFTYGTNGIRNGAATSIFLLALSFLKGGFVNKIIYALLSLIALNVHGSIIIPFAASLGALFIKNKKLLIYGWVGAVLLSFFWGGVVQNFFSALGLDSRMEDYLSSSNYADEIGGRFRWDFLLYSSVPVIIGAYAIFKRKIYTDTYALLLGTYIFANIIWIFLIRARFSNRFAYLSWFLYPIVLVYPLIEMPLFKKAPGLKLSIILIGQLVFTILMWAIMGF